ncbi:16S rRNA processing protein RimM [Rubrobacter xylanophilus DSM 9941]|uniref:Ribosome maturation factor RimM n=1 Tax=Rubrobacter xylanophilus (strain DSM 9941 / JCM 11954 / NBRC 16129 / PRD-1) TaxID=266117 RepID=RIMM_RUBXD|nr:ribosome maturation factor RimM [Rubrobacter xylanophilus]Q1AW75.1 RecName: Full=Ribosome maturation factor RimM [Rubrobacter xylanophilus DSM 9941]ABG04353.1 16S rRNA processing protein RimM [Rubrobacter xylanophilus DSM 9941]
MGELADPVVIGTITAPHGVRGTVRVRPAGEGRHLREGLSPLVGGRRRRILRARRTPKGFLVDLEGVPDRFRAAELRGEDLLLDRSELDAPEEDEFYVADLVGLEAVDERGGALGEVIETFPTPAHEVLVVRGEGGLLYVPFTREHVPEVDPRAGRAVVRPPEE